MKIGTRHGAVEGIERPIAWVVPGPLRQVTGGYLYDARIVDGLRDRGWTVGVIDVRSTRWPLDVPAGRRLVSALHRARWAAVVADELAHPAVVTALLGGGLRRALGGAPLVLLVHHLRTSEPAPWLSRAAALAVESMAVRSADLVVCTSETTAQTVRPLVRRGVPIEVVRPGWDTHASEGPSPPNPLIMPTMGPPTPTALPWERGRPPRVPGCAPLPRTGSGARGGGLSSTARGEDALRLLLVGHWTPRKGILEALAALARLDPGVTLDLVGEQDRDPAYAARVRSALRDPALAGRVQVHGRVSAEVLAGLYTGADALLLPSTHEGYGMVLAEALAHGLPIVATRVGAVPEVVRDGFEAELVPPGDVEALARAIARLAADPVARQRRSRLARERSQTLPRWSDSILAFEGQLWALLTRTLTGA